MPKRKPKEYNAGKLMQEMELELIASMKRNFERHERWEKSEGFEWEQWQSAKLRDLKRYQVANRKIVGRYSKPMTEYVKDHIRNQFLEGGRKVDTEVESILEKGKSMIKGTPSLDFFTGNNKKLGKLINAVTGDLSTAHTAVLRHMDDVYRKTIFKATLFGSSGAVTVDKAIDMATKEFLEKGINCIRYADGKRVNIASYTGMAVRTASKRAYLTGEGERRKEWGVSTVRISAYTGCSNLCKPWQGRIYIDDVWSGGTAADGDYPLLSVAIQGKLFHPNCKHTSSTYFPEVDEADVVIKGDETAEYAIIQRENEINRNMQKYKRMREGSLDPDNIKKYEDKMNRWEEKFAEVKMASKNEIIWSRNGTKITSEKYKELMDYANDKGVKLSGFRHYDGNIEIIKRLVNDVNVVAQDFPLVKERKHIVTIQLDQYLNDDDFAVTNGHIIRINANAYRNEDVLKSEYNKLSESNWFVKNTNYSSIIFHEMGHVVDNIYRVNSIALAKEILQVKEKIDVLNYVENNLSQYAALHENGKEIISEVFSDCYGSTSPCDFSLKFIDKCVILK